MHEIQEVTLEKLQESFFLARELIDARTLEMTKKLVELYVGRVTIFNNYVEVLYKFHPDLSFKDSGMLCGSGRNGLNLHHRSV
ncbi:hypothetical protein SDC9_205364 [bioreactor metagenome]|uniref:Uncharacterized protein n=1 Tax=bioreactor metagenome TaxID=1076179 RepID=A0A645J3H3_9ZZZZ